MKSTSFALSMACLAMAATSTFGAGQSMTSKYSQRDLLRNWTLSVCLATVYKDPTTKEDANQTAAAYLEYGRQGIEAYDELRKLVDAYAARRYAGSTGAEFNTMKCIDLLNSPELEKLSSKLISKTK